MNFLLALVALAALTLSSSAGTATIGATDTTVSLASDPSPPGATQLVIRYSSFASTLTHGYENIDPAASSCFTTDAQWALLLNNGATNVVTERLQATDYFNCLAPYDGTYDFAGTSGVTYSEFKSKTNTPWRTHTGTPTSLSVIRRGSAPAPGNTDSTQAWAPTTVVEWNWI